MTDPCKLQAIAQAAVEWYEARQAVIDGCEVTEIMADRYFEAVYALKNIVSEYKSE